MRPLETVVRRTEGGRHEPGDLRLESRVLILESIVLLLQFLGNGLEVNAPLDLALLVFLETGLELGELRLLSLAERPLGHTVL